MKNYKAFIGKANEFLNNQTKQNLNIDDPINFHIKWNILNENIYSQIETYKDRGEYSDLIFPKYNKDFFKHYLPDTGIIPDYMDTISNSKYIVLAGVMQPILIFSKKENVTYVVWIPYGWPSGSGWGYRSFKIGKLDGDILSVSNMEIMLEFNLALRKVRAYDKKK